MSKFTFVFFREVRCIVSFYKLHVDERCPIDEFWQEIRRDGNLSKQLTKAIKRMEEFGNGLRLPETKVKMIGRAKNGRALMEVKTRDLRIYLFRDRNNAIVVLGGKKSGQKQDIKRFISIVNQIPATP